MIILEKRSEKVITREEVDELRRAHRAASLAIENSPLAKVERDLNRRWQRATRELEAQEKAAKVQAKADRKVESKAEFKAAKGKHPLRELVADESVVGTFEGWRFAIKTGGEIRLQEGFRTSDLSICGSFTWEALRSLIARQGWPRFRYGGKSVEGFAAIRASDQTIQSFAADNVVAWKETDR